MPDVDSYVDSKTARAAIATLSGGLDTDDGFIALTGDVGVGKTMVARRLLRELDRDRFAVAEVIGARLELGDVLENVAIAFGLAGSMCPGEPLSRLRDARQHDGREGVLVVDEAEDLGADTLRSLDELVAPRLGGRRGLHVCLVSSHLPTGLRELRRRGEGLPVGAACALASLDAEDTRAYVLRRLQRAGWTGRPAFDAPSTHEIHALSQGNPARINLLCGRLLLHLSMTRSDDDVQVELVRAIDAQLEAEVSGEPNPEPHGRVGAGSNGEGDALLPPLVADPDAAPALPAASSSAPASTPRPRVAVGNEIDAMFARAPALLRTPAQLAANEENVAFADVGGPQRKPALEPAVESSSDNAMPFANGMDALFKSHGRRDLALAERPPSKPPGRAIRWWRQIGSRYVAPSALMLGGVGLGGAIAWYAATMRPTPFAAPGVATVAQPVARPSASTVVPVSQALLQTAAETLDAAPARAGVGADSPARAVALAPPAAHRTPSHAVPGATPGRHAIPGVRHGGNPSQHGGGAVAGMAAGPCSQELTSLGLCVAGPARPPALPARKATAAGDSGEPSALAPATRRCAPAEVALGLCPAP